MNKKILEEANKLINNEFLNETNIEGVKLFRISNFIEKTPIQYDVTLIILLQGEKVIYLPNKQIKYNKDNYLVVPINLPVECETYGSSDEPIIALSFDIDKMMMLDIISSLDECELSESTNDNMGIFQDKVTLEIEDIIYRLLKALQSKEESKILGTSILRELYYRVATGQNAHFLQSMFSEHNRETKIAKSLKDIHDNYNRNIDIDSLARKEDMSLSTYHRYFKQITSYSPLQYIKKIRLNKAKDLIEKENLQVNDTAYEVGYVSVSQFSRDFKNYFGFPPKEAKAC